MIEQLMESKGTMSRDAQRRKASLNQFYAQKRKQDDAKSREKRKPRPRNVNTVTTLEEADTWRVDAAKELQYRIGQLQRMNIDDDPQGVRDANEYVVSLSKDLDRWERRVVELGGSISRNSREAVQYFGAAAKLPEAVAAAGRAKKGKQGQQAKERRDAAQRLEDEMLARMNVEFDDSYYGASSQASKAAIVKELQQVDAKLTTESRHRMDVLQEERLRSPTSPTASALVIAEGLVLQPTAPDDLLFTDVAMENTQKRQRDTE